MGNKPCCCKEDDPKVEVQVKIKDIYCCDNISSSCCIRTTSSVAKSSWKESDALPRTEKKHHHHKTNHNLSLNQHHSKVVL